jgi:hypothetical protein
MSYIVTTSKSINNVSNVNNITDNSKYDLLTPFHHILESLVEHGWLFVNCDTNIISIRKLFYELEEIRIEYHNDTYHFTLPINNSNYSYYRKIHQVSDALNYLQLYVDNLY